MKPESEILIFRWPLLGSSSFIILFYLSHNSFIAIFQRQNPNLWKSTKSLDRINTIFILSVRWPLPSTVTFVFSWFVWLFINGNQLNYTIDLHPGIKNGNYWPSQWSNWITLTGWPWPCLPDLRSAGGYFLLIQRFFW